LPVEPLGHFEILEHTADVGIRARGPTLEEAFRQAALGLADIMGARRDATGERLSISLSGEDIEGLLVDWLNEVLWLLDARDGVLTGVTVHHVDASGVEGEIFSAPRGDEVLEGTAVKAVTYHQLKVEAAEGLWTARVFVDV
jgi:SHS2 domain-containing protein